MRQLFYRLARLQAMTAKHINSCKNNYESIEIALRELTVIRAEMVADTKQHKSLLDAVHDNYHDSARNFLHYLGLRRHDMRQLQSRLAELGLSSLGRAESHPLATIDAVLDVLHKLAQRSCQPSSDSVIDFATGQRLLAEHTEQLLGPASTGRGVRIMVTMPTEAAHDYSLVHSLLQQGMDCMRINCAHDNAGLWLQMIDNLRCAERDLGRSCRVIMDLAGPKLRTGPIEPGPAVICARPQRDAFGQVTRPARIWLMAESSPRQSPMPADISLPVPITWLSLLHTGDNVHLTDARGARRSFMVVDVTEDGCWAEISNTTYFVPGIVLHLLRSDGSAYEAQIGELPPLENVLSLHMGDLLILTRDLKPGRPTSYDSHGQVLTPARIGCTIPEVFNKVHAGESIWFDDGKIGAVIVKVESDQVLVRITQTQLGGTRLRADKGINLPDSDLDLGAMTDKDIEDLPFVAQHADVVELSFANTERDVVQLQQHLASLGKHRPAIVLKIETCKAFQNLPDMLLTAMRWPCCGVMIARGDLAVECGFERLAEVQEEILWISEAAHIPVIWATQVLETLAKKGMPSRTEISDVAMGHRAECVMLNKGPHILSAVKVLDNILRRMQSHQSKKSSMLRELRLAHRLVKLVDADDITTTAHKTNNIVALEH
jgi:pyruvate kinase